VFCGLVPPGFDALVAGLGLSDVVRYEGYLPHEVVSRELMAADVLWMTVGRRPGAEGISTGKLFEYVGTRKPVLGLVPEGTARRALEAYGAAFIAEPDDVPGIAGAIGTAFAAWEAGGLPSPDAAFVAAHDRRVLAGRVAALLEAVVS